MAAHAPGTCHCCAHAAAEEVANRAGLEALRYRIDTFATFRRTMLEAIARQPALARLTTRQSDDFSITLLELWAVVGDVLTFYQERIANEAFLRTATQRDSVLRLARMLDYRLGVGLAAQARTAFTADDGKSVRIPTALRLMSVPEQDQIPQIYETIESIIAEARLNEVRVFPLPAGINPLARGATSAVVLAAPEKLAPNDKVLFFDRRTIEEKSATSVTTVEEARLAAWLPAVQSELFHPDTTAAARYARTLRFFGFNAPTNLPVFTPNADPTKSGVWTVAPVTGLTFGAGDSAYPLDARYEELKSGTRLLLRVSNDPFLRTGVIVASSESSQTIAAITDTVTVATVRRAVQIEQPAVTGSNRVFARGLEGNPLQWSNGWTLVAQTTNRDDVTSALAAVDRGADFDLFARGRNGQLLQKRGATWSDLGGILTSAPAAASWGANRLDVFVRGLNRGLWHIRFDGTWHNWESLGGILTSAPAAVSWAANRIDVFVRGLDGALWHRWFDGTWHGWESLGGAIAGAPTVASRAANRLDVFARADDGTLLRRSWNGTQWLPWQSMGGQLASDPAAVRSDANSSIVRLRAVAPDSTMMQAEWDGVAASLTWTPVNGGFGAINDRRGATLYQLDPGDIVFRRFTYGSQISGTSVAVPLSHLASIDKKHVILLSDATHTPHRAVVTGSASFASRVAEDADHLRIDFTPALPQALDAATAVLRGNVAESTQGESIHDEILGDGDAAVPFQRFTLRKKPLTYVATAENLFGESSLRVLVNGEKWTEVPTLFAQPANARVYTTRQLDDGSTVVQFGDGVTGARLPSGRGNIIATYRAGAGVGAITAGQLSILLDQPPGLKSAINRAAAEGGKDPETLDNARAAVPTTVKTFGRAVSLRDFELVTTGTGGVAKSNATSVWHGLERAVFLTVAGPNGTTFAADALERIRLALANVRDTRDPLLLGNFTRAPIVTTINIRVDARFLRDNVTAAVRQALRDFFSFAHLRFAQTIHLSVLSALVQRVAGVVAVDIDVLHFKGFQTWTAAELGLRGATSAPDQKHLRIFAARPRPRDPAAPIDPITRAAFGTALPEVFPAEQAVIEQEASDLTVNATGGLT